jgi:hypothetical protein
MRRAAHRKAMRYPAAKPVLSTRFEMTEHEVRLTTFCLSSLCVCSSLSIMLRSFSSVFMSMRCCTVSCRTL